MSHLESSSFCLGENKFVCIINLNLFDVFVVAVVVVVVAFNEYLHLFQTADYAKLTRKFERKNNRNSME